MAKVRHRQRRGMLKMYYGVGEESGKSTPVDYCDINGAHFKPEEFLEKLFKEKSLTELLDKEADIAKRTKLFYAYMVMIGLNLLVISQHRIMVSASGKLPISHNLSYYKHIG